MVKYWKQSSELQHRILNNTANIVIVHHIRDLRHPHRIWFNKLSFKSKNSGKVTNGVLDLRIYKWWYGGKACISQMEGLWVRFLDCIQCWDSSNYRDHGRDNFAPKIFVFQHYLIKLNAYSIYLSKLASTILQLAKNIDISLTIHFILT